MPMSTASAAVVTPAVVGHAVRHARPVVPIIVIDGSRVVAERPLCGAEFLKATVGFWPEHDSRIKIGLEQRKCVRRVGASLLNMSMFN